MSKTLGFIFGSFFIFSLLNFSFFPLLSELVYYLIFNKNRSNFLFKNALSSEKITLTNVEKRIKSAVYFGRNFSQVPKSISNKPKSDLRIFF